MISAIGNSPIDGRRLLTRNRKPSAFLHLFCLAVFCVSHVGPAVAQTSDCNVQPVEQLDADKLIAALSSHEAYLKNTGSRQPANLSCQDIRAILGSADKPDLLAGRKLDGIVLTGANLEGVNLRATGLVEADLTQSRLNGADLSGARLTNATLQGAQLVRTKFDMNSSLIKANLRDADLTSATLEGVNLQRADLTHALLMSTNIKDANLKDTIVAETVWEPVGEIGGDKVSGMRGLRQLQVSLCERPTLNRDMSQCPALVQSLNVAALTSLSQALAAASNHRRAREVIYARERMKTKHQWELFKENPLSNVGKGGSALIRVAALGLTSNYGLAPWRVLVWILVSAIVFAAIYLNMLQRNVNPNTNRLVWRYSQGTLETDEEGNVTALAEDRFENADVAGKRKQLVSALTYSAFCTIRFGFENFNLRDWALRLMHRPGVLVGLGRFKTFGAIQSFICLVLLGLFGYESLWVYFFG
ncbi:MAG: pentapeptide repeat-containing protein [Pseudomonadota bacterium]